MQRHFSNRGEAHPEAVATRMSAGHKPSVKPDAGKRLRGNVPIAWRPQAATAPTKPTST